MRSLYIYFRVRPSERQLLWGAISDMQSAMRGEMPGLAASLSERIDAQDSGESPDAPALLTWMETYHFNGHASDDAWHHFEAVLAQRTHSLPQGIEGSRHMERFVRISAPCWPAATPPLGKSHNATEN